MFITIKVYDDDEYEPDDYDDEDNELTRVQPQESHPPGVVGAAHPGIGHNSDKDWIETAVHHFWFHINPFHSAQSELG